MNYKHLSKEERSCIRKYYVEGLSYRKIAKLIGRKCQHQSHGRYAETAHICTTFQLTIRTPHRKSIY